MRAAVAGEGQPSILIFPTTKSNTGLQRCCRCSVTALRAGDCIVDATVVKCTAAVLQKGAHQSTLHQSFLQCGSYLRMSSQDSQEIKDVCIAMAHCESSRHTQLQLLIACIIWMTLL